MTRADSLLHRVRAVLMCAALFTVGTLWAPGPAHASACTGGSGVSVVVDFGQYGGVQAGCAPDPGNGLSALSQAGFQVTLVTGQAFVCRIDGAPPAQDDSCARTPPETAYWSYWQAAPGSRSWAYSGQGAGSTQPAAGATEGWAFGAGTPPRMAPPVNTAAPPPPPPKPPPPPPPLPPPAGSTRPPPPAPDPTGAPRQDPNSTTTSRAPGGGGPGSTAGPPAPGPAPPTSSASPGSATGTTTDTTTAPATTGGRSDAAAAGSSAPNEVDVEGRSTDTDDTGAPWGVLIAGMVAAALTGGAYWQIRRRP